MNVLLSQHATKRRRSESQGIHIDFIPVWTFPAAVLLPTPLTVALVTLMHWQHRRITREPRRQSILSAVPNIVAAFGAHILTLATASNGWLAPTPVTADVSLLLAGSLFYGQQFLVNRGVVVLTSRQRITIREVLDGSERWKLEGLATSLGMVLALAHAHPLAAMVVVSIAAKINKVAKAHTQAEQAVQQAEHRARSAEKAACTDWLTGLLNRHGWHSATQNALQVAAEHARPIGVLVIDLDHFKKVNDTYGHSAGDDALRAVARVIAATVRSADVVARVGGEEFCVLLPDTHHHEALNTANRLCQAISSPAAAVPVRKLIGREPTILRCTASIGVVVADVPRDLDQLISLADHAAYEAKHRGRNRVVLALPPGNSRLNALPA